MTIWINQTAAQLFDLLISFQMKEKKEYILFQIVS